MPQVRLGNVGVREVIGADPDGTPIYRRYDGQSTSVISLPSDDAGWSHSDRMRTITHDDGHWRALSSATPVWVESDDPALQRALAAYWDIPAGRPAGWTDQIEETR